MQPCQQNNKNAGVSTGVFIKVKVVLASCSAGNSVRSWGAVALHGVWQSVEAFSVGSRKRRLYATGGPMMRSDQQWSVLVMPQCRGLLIGTVFYRLAGGGRRALG